MDHVQHGAPFGMTIRLGQVALHDQAAAVLHQSITDEAQHRTRAGRLLVKPRLGVSGRDVRGVRTPLAPEINFGVAVLVGGAGHRGWQAHPSPPVGSCAAGA